MHRSIVLLLLLVLDCRAAEWKPQSIPGEAGAVSGERVWLRAYVKVPTQWAKPQEKDLYRDSMTLALRDVPGPVVVWLNGEKIAEAASVRAEENQRFKVPKVLELVKFNCLVFELRAPATAALRHAPIMASYFDQIEFTAFEATATQPSAAEMAALTEQPARAFFTEKDARKSSTPLSANAENMPGIRMTPQDELAQLKPADDLAVDLIVSDPLVAQPTHMSFDERGRLWVTQYRQYPYPAGIRQISRDMYYRAVFDKVPPAPPNHDKGRDRISIHEDTDGDGTFDKHKVLLDGLNMANAALRGYGGIWVMNTPYLMFYPDADGDDVPDRDPEVRLAGFGLEDTHSASNGLVWGPDGWLYGVQGSTVTCRVVRPGIDPPGSKGVYFEGCLVWRYHPLSKAFEIFCEGGGNNFGLEFDAEGRAFCGHNGGTTRAWHFVQEGVYLMQGKEPGKFGPPRNPYSFEEMPLTKSANTIARFTHNTIVAEGTAMPTSYTGRFIGADPLHRTLTVSDRTTVGSTFESSDVTPALTTDAIVFRPVFLTNGADGAIYVADFTEEYIAHGQNYQGQIDNTSGRIFRLRGKNSTLEKDVNLSVKTTDELIALLNHANKWHRTTAVRLLGERRDRAAAPKLRALLDQPATHPALEALWAIHQLGALDETTALAALKHPAAPVRAWTIRLLGDRKELSPRMAGAVTALARGEANDEVRAQIASTSRRLAPEQRLQLLTALLDRPEDMQDKFTPLLAWYSIEAICDSDREAVLKFATGAWSSRLAREGLIPKLMRRSAAKSTRTDLLACARLLESAPADQRKSLLAAFEEAFKGRALPALPDELVAALAKAGNVSVLLRVRRGEAIDEALALASDAKRKPEERLPYVRVFGEVKQAGAVPVLLNLARTDASADVRNAALASLQSYDDAKIGADIANAYTTLPAEAQPAAQNLLASRAAWRPALLALVKAGTISAKSLPPDIVARLDLQPTAKASAASRERVEQLSKLLAGKPGDPYAGEATYMARCSACHMLFHKGGRIGPNLTPYQRDDLGTMLLSIVEPNAEIREGFENFLVTTKDGRALSGFLADKDEHVVVLRGFDGQDLTIQREQIAEMKNAGRSLMPDGILEGLSEKELRDFFAYLRIPQPISR
ncbi:MAG: PVC-type heme-binding CxxCH protein [Chthoniobacteraceae bacterium]